MRAREVVVDLGAGTVERTSRPLRRAVGNGGGTDPDPDGPTLTMRSSASHYDTTWTFDDDYPTGVWADGSPYVVAPQGVQLTAISPAPTGSGTSRRNGGMINPHRNSNSSGYDGRVSGGHTLAFGSDATAGGFPIHLAPHTTLLSGVSADESAGSRSVIRQINALTVVPEPPDRDGYFRPSYASTDKTPVWHIGDMRMDRVPSLPMDPEPDLVSSSLGFTGQVMNDQWPAYHSWRAHQPTETLGTAGTYHRFFGRRVTRALAIAMTAMTDPVKKVEQVRRIVQWCIDARASFLTLDAWRNDLNNSTSHRYVALAFAATVLDDPQFFTVPRDHPWVRWTERWQYRFSTANGGYVWTHSVDNGKGANPWTAVRIGAISTGAAGPPSGTWREELPIGQQTVGGTTFNYHNQISDNMPMMALAVLLMDDLNPGFRAMCDIDPLVEYGYRWAWEEPDSAFRAHVSAAGHPLPGSGPWGAVSEDSYVNAFWTAHHDKVSP